MDKKLVKIKKILEAELEDPSVIFTVEDPTCESVEICGELSFMVNEDKLGLTFYSGTHPNVVAFYIRLLHAHKVVDYEIFETMYPKLDEKGEYIETLFGDEADEEYRQMIFKSMQKDLFMAYNAITYGPKQ